jgi:CheY-like chemotaxis protein
MTVLIVVLMFVGFIVLDVLVRLVTRRLQERRARREREAALDTALRLDFTDEARSLRRAEVPNPAGRILAVDDEPVVLESLRRILVLDGFSVDTVERGPEALGLVQRNDYDLVFTDLKMPGMDGVEVVRGIKQLRPDIDVAVITGFATVESAVETMRDGAADYVQKPFTPDELRGFARRLLLKRQARLAAQRLPRVHVVSPALAPAMGAGDFCVPGGAFLSAGHVWARIEASGQVQMGLDDFVCKALGAVERVDLPEQGASLQRGEPLLTLHRGGGEIRVSAPLSGRVASVNTELGAHPEAIGESPYDAGWVCLLEPDDLIAELSGLRIGTPVIEWYQQQILRLREIGGPAADGIPQVAWETLQAEFLQPRAG